MRLALALTFLLTACQSAPNSGPGSPGAATEADLPDPSMIQDVSVAETTELLAPGFRQVSPSIAIQTIDLWLVRLDTVSVDGTAEVRDDLDALRDLLQSSPLDGAAIGKRLNSLASSTDVMASPENRLAPLSAALRAAGRTLAPDSSSAGSTTEVSNDEESPDQSRGQ